MISYFIFALRREQADMLQVFYLLCRCYRRLIIASAVVTSNKLIAALQRQNAGNLKQIFPAKEYRGLSPNFHIHVSVSELYIPMIGLPVLLEEICRLIM
jgi:hypothetical protein